jgi:hypothetical protein
VKPWITIVALAGLALVVFWLREPERDVSVSVAGPSESPVSAAQPTAHLEDAGVAVLAQPSSRETVGADQEKAGSVQRVIEQEAGCRIIGVARESDGAPAVGVAIWLLRAERPGDLQYLRWNQEQRVHDRVETDMRGHFTFEAVKAGDWRVGPAPRENRWTGNETVSVREPIPLARFVQILEGEERVEVGLEVQRGLMITGRVVGPAGKTVSGARVQTRGVSATCEPGGEFLIGPFAPGEYELVGSASRRSGHADSQRVLARAGEAEVVLTLRVSGGIAGVVLGREGLPTKAAVEIVALDPTETPVYRVSLGNRRDGTFAFDGLVPGNYHICAHDNAGNVGRLEFVAIEPGNTTAALVVNLAPGAFVRVRMPPGEARLLTAFRAVQSGVEMGVGTSSDEMISVLPGPVTVELLSYDVETRTLSLLASRSVTAVAGERVEVVFERVKDG